MDYDFSAPVLRHKDHKYIKPNANYISVSALLDYFKNKFDAKAMSAAIAAKPDAKRKPEYVGLSQAAILGLWKSKADNACEIGTDFHSQIEKRIKDAGDASGETMVDYAYRWFQAQKPTSFRLEFCLDNPVVEIAGTCDLMYFTADGRVNIVDWKTNASLITDYENVRPSYMLHCFADKQVCNLSTYALQINIYARMLEMRGYTIGNLHIFHAASWGANVLGSKEIEFDVKDIPCRREDAIKAFNWYQENVLNNKYSTRQSP